MTKQQTALQTLIAWGDEMMKEHPLKHLSFAEAIDKAEELLEMEKEQMDKVSEDRWLEGCSYMKDNKRIYESFEQYYKETYKTNKQ